MNNIGIRILNEPFPDFQPVNNSSFVGVEWLLSGKLSGCVWKLETDVVHGNNSDSLELTELPN